MARRRPSVRPFAHEMPDPRDPHEMATANAAERSPARCLSVRMHARGRTRILSPRFRKPHSSLSPLSRQPLTALVLRNAYAHFLGIQTV